MPIASIFNYIGVIVLVVLVLILVVSNIHVVQQSRAYVVERLGAFQRDLGRRPALEDPLH